MDLRSMLGWTLQSGSQALGMILGRILIGSCLTLSILADAMADPARTGPAGLAPEMVEAASLAAPDLGGLAGLDARVERLVRQIQAGAAGRAGIGPAEWQLALEDLVAQRAMIGKALSAGMQPQARVLIGGLKADLATLETLASPSPALGALAAADS